MLYLLSTYVSRTTVRIFSDDKVVEKVSLSYLSTHNLVFTLSTAFYVNQWSLSLTVITVFYITISAQTTPEKLVFYF